MGSQEARSAALTCTYCGLLDWTVRKYGRVTHKQACPHRTDPWHQGDPKASAARVHHSGVNAQPVCSPLCGASKAYGRFDQPWKHEPQCPVRIEWEKQKEAARDRAD